MDYKKYWGPWISLLVLTLVMLVADRAFTGTILLTALLLAMTAKAILIAGTFMHLKWEHKGLIWTVVLGLVVVGAALFAGIAADGVRAHTMANRW